MTLKTDLSGVFAVGAPPQSGTLESTLVWCTRLFRFLGTFLRRPEFPTIVLTRIDSAAWDEYGRLEDGMLMYAGPGVLGPQEGLYIRETGVWKKVAGT
jgi:hypothetical protein